MIRSIAILFLTMLTIALFFVAVWASYAGLELIKEWEFAIGFAALATAVLYGILTFWSGRAMTALYSHQRRRMP